MTENQYPPLCEKTASDVEKIYSHPTFQKAMQMFVEGNQAAIDFQCEMCEIPAPTFAEEKRAAHMVEKLKEYGLVDVTIDEVGNVIGKRPGVDPNGPVLVLGAHLDSVFPAETDVTVKREGNRYTAPGIGDNCSGHRAIFEVLRALQTLDIQTTGDVWFVGTVGEEGLGDIRGAKHLFGCGRHKIDGFLAVDTCDVGYLLKGASGSHRWRFTVKGPGGHSYIAFGKVPSAIHAVCLAGAKTAHLKVPAEPKTTFTIGTIKGGATVNSIAAECTCDVDIRSVDNDELLKAEEFIINAFKEAVEEENQIWGITDPELQVHLEMTPIGNRPAGMRPDDCPVVQTARSAQKALGIELTRLSVASTDANAPMSLGIPATCIGSGGVGHGEHSLAEYFEDVESWRGPQLVLLTTLGLVGAFGVAPSLKKREA